MNSISARSLSAASAQTLIKNPAKRVADPFEDELLKFLGTLGALVMVDAGAPGGEEEARVRKAIAASGLTQERVGIHEGSFASFAAMISASSLYVGYDSAGQHVAAALGIPLVSVFAGFASQRMLERWSPQSPGPCRVIPVRCASMSRSDTLVLSWSL